MVAVLKTENCRPDQVGKGFIRNRVVPHKDNESLSQGEKMDQWRAIAADHGWEKKQPNEKYKVKSAKEFIVFNYGLMGLCLLISLPCLFWCLSTKGSWIESTENGLRNSAGKQLTLDQITKVDKAKWEKKIILIRNS